MTAVTVQDTTGVHAVHPMPAEIVREQIDACAGRHRRRRDQDRHAGQRAKSSPRVADALRARHAKFPLVLDPVLAVHQRHVVAGRRGRRRVLKQSLLPLATLVTPNMPGSEALLPASKSNRRRSARGGQSFARAGRANAAAGQGRASRGRHGRRCAGDRGRHAASFSILRASPRPSPTAPAARLPPPLPAGLAQGMALADAVGARAQISCRRRSAPRPALATATGRSIISRHAATRNKASSRRARNVARGKGTSG